MHTEDINAIIEKAKRQRADAIGSAISKHLFAPLLVVAIPVMLMQVQWTPSAPIAALEHPLYAQGSARAIDADAGR